KIIMQARLPHIDIARGIGILLMVAGHNWIILSGKGELYRIVYSFHIPLFFVLSGIFFNYEKPLGKTLKEKLQVLLVPYFLTAGVIEMISLFFNSKINSFTNGLLWIAYGSGPHLRWVGFWFLPHLFLVSIFCWVLLGIFKTYGLNKRFQTLALSAMLVIGWFSIRSFWGISFSGVKLNGLPFSADILLVSSFYFMLGSLAGDWIKERQFQPVPFVIAAAVFLILHAATDFTTDLNLRRYDNLIAATALAVTGSFMVIAASKFLAHFTAAKNILGYFGRNSLAVLIFHSFFQDNLFVFLSEYTKRYFYVGLATFTAAMVGSILVIEIINRVEFLGKMYGNSRPN
ncbi:MAG: acyltransferase family protein, partial [Chloroflexota bacterium]